MFKKLHLCVGVGLLSGILMVTLPAVAQQQEGGEFMDAPKVTEEEMDRAAHAYMEITEIREEYGEVIQNTADHEEMQRLQMKANEKMVEAVQDEGLDVDQYNQIIKTIQEDNEAMQYFMAKVQSLQ